MKASKAPKQNSGTTVTADEEEQEDDLVFALSIS